MAQVLMLSNVYLGSFVWCSAALLVSFCLFDEPFTLVDVSYCFFCRFEKCWGLWPFANLRSFFCLFTFKLCHKPYAFWPLFVAVTFGRKGYGSWKACGRVAKCLHKTSKVYGAASRLVPPGNCMALTKLLEIHPSTAKLFFDCLLYTSPSPRD